MTKSQESLRWRDMGSLLLALERKECAKCAHPASEKLVGPVMGFVALVAVERLLLSACHDLGLVVRRVHRTQVLVQGQASGLLGRVVKYLKNLQCAPLVAAPPATS